jgi:hypothetical protein
MEATYYTDLMSQMGEGALRTSVIHTAPGCSSVLDCEEDHEIEQFGVRHSTSPVGPDEQWQNTDGREWRNPQLRISLKRGRAESNLVVR